MTWLRRIFGVYPKLGLGDQFILDTGYGYGQLVTVQAVHIRNDQSGFIVSLEAAS